MLSIVPQMLLLELYTAKVAIPRWLCLHQKEGLYQEKKITARISGRSHLIKENKAKNYKSLCGGGGGSKMATQAVPP
jgi:hypothetical protein